VAEVPLRFRWVRRLAEAIVAVDVVAALAMIVVGVVLLWPPIDPNQWIPGVTLLLTGALLSAAAILPYILMVMLLKIEATTHRLHSTMLDIHEHVARIGPPLREIAENSQLSDAARSIAHRNKEREALRNAIRDDILHQDWEAAYYLIDQMETRYGYRQEAQRIRREVETSRQETMERMIVEAVQHIDTLCGQRQWDGARAEAERLLRLFPRHEKVKDVMELIERRRDEYKASLLRSYEEAFRRNESDRCLQILRELDFYVTPSEAEALAESARGVFRAALLNMGVKFSLAVTEKRWRDALESGLEITTQFPNSRMAQEVREKLDALQKRAGFSPDDVADMIQQKRAQAPPRTDTPV
jgi:hypothetical protein